MKDKILKLDARKHCAFERSLRSGFLDISFLLSLTLNFSLFF